MVFDAFLELPGCKSELLSRFGLVQLASDEK